MLDGICHGCHDRVPRPLLGDHNMQHHVPVRRPPRHPANDIYLGSNPLLADSQLHSELSIASQLLNLAFLPLEVSATTQIRGSSFYLFTLY